MGSASEDEEDEDNSTASSVLKHHSLHSSLTPAAGETNNNSLPHSDISSSIGQVSCHLTFLETSYHNLQYLFFPIICLTLGLKNGSRRFGRSKFIRRRSRNTRFSNGKQKS